MFFSGFFSLLVLTTADIFDEFINHPLPFDWWWRVVCVVKSANMKACSCPLVEKSWDFQVLHVNWHFPACGAEGVLAAHMVSDVLAQWSRSGGLSQGYPRGLCNQYQCGSHVVSGFLLSRNADQPNLEKLGSCPKELESFFDLVAILYCWTSDDLVANFTSEWPTVSLNVQMKPSVFILH